MIIEQFAGESGRSVLGKAGRIAILGLAMGALTSTNARLADNLTAIPLLNTQCAQVGDISVGANGTWSHCRVMKSHWFSRVALVDLYQAQYCLGSSAGQCDQTALMIFANYPLTPVGRLLVERIDPGGTIYDDPIVTATAQGKVLILSARAPSATAHAGETKSYYRWDDGNWVRISERETFGATPQQIERAIPESEKSYSWSSRMPGWRTRLLPD